MTHHLDKSRVADSFSASASTYDQLSFLQQEVAESLMKLIPDVSGTLVDLGCGTGFCFDWLKYNQDISESTMLGIDLAEGMVRFASEERSSVSASWACGDAEQLPLADACVNTFISSLAIQWCEDLDSLMQGIQRALQPGGSFWFATLGPKTLHELRSAWRAVDDFVHVNEFVDAGVLQGAAEGAGLEVSSWQEKMITYRYDEVRQLTRELKGIGAHNVNEGRPAGLTGKKRILKFKHAYEQFREMETGKLPATYEVYYACFSRPATR